MGHAPFRWQQILHVVWVLGWADFAMKYRGSVLGFFWSFMAPFTKFLVIYFVFEPFVGSDIPQFPLYLFLGVIVWEYFVAMTSACVALPFDKASIIQKVRFPRVLLLFITAWTHMLIFMTHFLIFLLFALWFGVEFHIGVFYVVLILVQMSLLGVGVGGFLGAYVLKYRDIRHLWDVLLTVLFWLTPIMYPYRVEAPIFQELVRTVTTVDSLSINGLLFAFIRFQPLSVFLFDARRALLYADVTGIPSLAHAAGFTVLCVVIGAIGVTLFHRRSRFFLEEY